MYEKVGHKPTGQNPTGQKPTGHKPTGQKPTTEVEKWIKAHHTLFFSEIYSFQNDRIVHLFYP